MSEARRGIIRIASNYIRLGANLLLGLVLVRVLLGTIGPDGYALVALAGASIGLGAMAEAIMRGSLIRELGAAYHSGDREQFVESYNSAFLLALAAGALSLVLYGTIILFLPALGVPEEMLYAGRCFVAAKAVQAVALILASPAFNMYIVAERMPQFNLWISLDRAGMVVSAFALHFLPFDSTSSVAAYGVISAVVAIGLNLFACALLITRDARLVPQPARARWIRARSMAGMGGWNAMVLTANNLHIRLDHVLTSYFLGMVPWNALFGYAVQMGGYIFQLGGGVAGGVEAVAARMSSTGDVASLRRLLHHSTRIHGLVAFPGLAVMTIMAIPVIEVWVGDRLHNPETEVPLAATLLRILAVGFTVRALTAGWQAIFYGSGHIRSYAPILLVGGIANPIVAGLLLWLLPEAYRYTAMAWSFSGIFVIFTFVLGPVRTIPHLGLRFRDLYLPLLRPAAVTAICSPVLFVASTQIEHWNLWALVGVGAAFGIPYAVLSCFFVVSPSERKRFRGMVTNKAHGRSKALQEHVKA